MAAVPDPMRCGAKSALARLGCRLLALLLLGHIMPALAEESAPSGAGTSVTLRFWPDYSTGRYGEPSRTDMLAFPVNLRIERGAWALGVQTSYLSLSGPGGAVPRLGNAAVSVQEHRRESGLGDSRVAVTYSFIPGRDTEPYLDLAVQTRLPTATQPGLGAGIVEQVVRVDGGIPIANMLFLEGSLGRRFVPPQGGQHGHDFWIFWGSLGWDVRRDWTVGGVIDAQDRSARSNRPILEVGAFVEHRPQPDVTLGLYVHRGLTQDSAALAVSLRISRRFDL